MKRFGNRRPWNEKKNKTKHPQVLELGEEVQCACDGEKAKGEMRGRNRGQNMEGLVGHHERLGFYSKEDRKPSDGFRMSSVTWSYLHFLKFHWLQYKW